MSRLAAVLAVVLLLAAGNLPAQSPWRSPPDGGASLLPADPAPAMRLGGTDARLLASAELIDVAGMPFTRALRVTLSGKPSTAWGVQIMASTAGDIRKGDLLLMSLFARGFSDTSESGEARAVAYLQRSSAPNEKLASQGISAGKEWEQWLLPFHANLDLPSGQHNFVIHLGYQAQTIEVGGVAIVNYGVSKTIAELPRTLLSYRGRAADAPWRAAAAERIEAHRKADLRVRVDGPQGQALAGVKVRVAMTRHAFGFGSAVVARHIAAQSPDADHYRAIIEQFFNKVVFENDLKWPPWEIAKSNTNSSYRREWTETALNWLLDRSIRVRGHFVSWAPLDTANGMGPAPAPMETLRERLFAHIEDKLPALEPRIYEWDAVNHIAGWGSTLEHVYGTEIYAEIIRRARLLAPQSRMWINEGQILPGGSRRDDYQRIAACLAGQDAMPDGIGFMGHFSESSLTPVEEVYSVLDRFAAFGTALQLTELDVTTQDEQLQADYLRDIMTIAFSHPSMEAIVMWGFWEGAHWKPDAALWRRDWRIKPAGQAWLDLVFGRWWTDVELTTGPEGNAEARAFLGDYEITAACPGGSQSRQAILTPDGLSIGIRCPE